MMPMIQLACEISVFDNPNKLESIAIGYIIVLESKISKAAEVEPNEEAMIATTTISAVSPKPKPIKPHNENTINGNTI